MAAGWRNIAEAVWFAVSCGILAIVSVVFLAVAIVALGIDLATMHRRRGPRDV